MYLTEMWTDRAETILKNWLKYDFETSYQLGKCFENILFGFAKYMVLKVIVDLTQKNR